MFGQNVLEEATSVNPAQFWASAGPEASSSAPSAQAPSHLRMRIRFSPRLVGAFAPLPGGDSAACSGGILDSQHILCHEHTTSGAVPDNVRKSDSERKRAHRLR